MGTGAGTCATDCRVSYDAVPTERLPPPSPVREILGPCRPSGWVTVSAGGSRGARSRTVLHARDCAEAAPPIHVLSLEEALDLAERPATRLCVLCGAAQELEPLLRGFDHAESG